MAVRLGFPVTAQELLAAVAQAAGEGISDAELAQAARGRRDARGPTEFGNTYGGR